MTNKIYREGYTFTWESFLTHIYYRKESTIFAVLPHLHARLRLYLNTQFIHSSSILFTFQAQLLLFFLVASNITQWIVWLCFFWESIIIVLEAVSLTNTLCSFCSFLLLLSTPPFPFHDLRTSNDNVLCFDSLPLFLNMFLWLLLDSQQQYLFHEPRTEWKEWETIHPWLICIDHQVMVITTQYNILDSEDSKKRRVCVQVMMVSPFYSSCKVFNTLQASLHFFYHSTHTQIMEGTLLIDILFLSFLLNQIGGFALLPLDLIWDLQASLSFEVLFLLSFSPCFIIQLIHFSSDILRIKGQKITVCLSILLLLDFCSFESLKIGSSHKN